MNNNDWLLNSESSNNDYNQMNNNQPNQNYNNYSNNQQNDFSQMNQIPNNNYNQMNNNQPNMNNNNYQYNQMQYQNNNGKSKIIDILKNNSKVIVKLILVAIIGIIIVVVIKNFMSGSSNFSASKAEKTLTCTAHHEALGVVYDETYVFYINDGGATLKNITKIDLEKTTGISFVDGTEEDWAKEKKEDYKQQCNSTSDCTKVDVNYSKGKYFETIVYYDYSSNEKLKGMSADEIYNKQKTRYESGEVDGITQYTCN